MAMSELWSVARAAKFLDVSKKRIYQLIQQGRLESLKLSPRTTRVTRESVERLVEESKRRQRDELGLDFRPQARASAERR
jgi:excisionase family DNA binding protein